MHSVTMNGHCIESELAFPSPWRCGAAQVLVACEVGLTSLPAPLRRVSGVAKMYLMMYLDEAGKVVYTLKARRPCTLERQFCRACMR